MTRIVEPSPGWPGDVPAPLYSAEAHQGSAQHQQGYGDALEAWRWPLKRELVRVHCPRCRTLVLVAQVGLARAPNDEELVMQHRVGVILWGSRRARDGALDFARAAESRGEPRYRVPLTSTWLAPLDLIRDGAVPAWCDEHGDLEVPMGELRQRVAGRVADPNKQADRMAGVFPKP